jgi:hypothetical protein
MLSVIQHITQHDGFCSDTQHKGHSVSSDIVLSVFILSVMFYIFNAACVAMLCHNDECNYAECRYAECRGASSAPEFYFVIEIEK